ncbi:MAG: cell division protein FtsZ [Candidatus Latescibacteria bacterium]|nr:cell division protein FtsZ [Candidatus Latescibacterota bacterium]
MTFKIVDEEPNAKIKVIGVGGAGGNAINRMVSSGMRGVEFVAINTDSQDLEDSSADERIYIGEGVTRGLGAGARPEVGRQAIEEDREKVAEKLAGTDLVFITAGMGGGTGTGAAPVVAEVAKEVGALAVGIVTMPFKFEGLPRTRNAEGGIDQMQEWVDTLITIQNQRLMAICSREVTFAEALVKADEVLMEATRGIADLITTPGMINLDFNDVKTVITQGGDAIMGVGTHRGENRATEAAKQAINSPLLEDVDIDGAKGVLINMSAGKNFTLFEVDEATQVVQDAVGSEANIIFGTVMDDSLVDEMRVTVIATGFNQTGEAQMEVVTGKEVEGAVQRTGTDFSEPAIKRRSDAKASDKKELNRDSLDYPAFLRRQKA